MRPIVSGARKRGSAAGAPVPAESISIALTNTAFAGRRSATSQRILTLTRVGGYSGTVSFAVTGLPTGTTAAFSPITLTGATLTTTVTLTHAIDAALVTADAFVITASGSGVSDATVNATVTVEDVLPEASWASQEPTTPLYTVDRLFDTLAEVNNITVSQPSDFPARPPAITADAGPYSSSSYRRVYIAGTQAAEAGFVNARANPELQATHVFTACAFKFSPGFVQHGASTKFMYPHRRTTSATYTQDFTLQTQMPPTGTVGDGTFRWKMETQGPSANYYDNQNGYSQASPYVMQADTWYQVQTEHIVNTPGVSDGTFRLWVSEWTGTDWLTPLLLMEYTAFQYHNTTSAGWWGINTFAVTWRWNGYFGGSAGAVTVPADQYVYFNRVRVSVLATL